MKLRCPRCGSQNDLEKPWAHLHCPDCGLRRFVDTFETSQSAPPRRAEPQVHNPAPRQSGPRPNPDPRPQPAPASTSSVKSKTWRKELSPLSLLTGAFTLAGFILGSRFGVAVLVLALLLDAYLIVRWRFKKEYLLHPVLACVLLAGGMLSDVVFPPTARCVDGTYSYSAHHRGTCSWHGGVAQWNPEPWWKKYVGE